MAQSALTVTPPNPTPPTNFSFVGATPPTDPAQAQADDGSAGSLTVFAAKTAAAGSGTSVDHEGKGTETVVTAPGSRAECPTQAFSCLGSYTATPNASHASNMQTGGAPTITGAPAPNNIASGSGTVAITITGTGFNRSSVVYIDGVAQNTNYVSATSLTVTNAPKKATAGTRSVVVTNTGTGLSSSASTWTFT